MMRMQTRHSRREDVKGSVNLLFTLCKKHLVRAAISPPPKADAPNTPDDSF